MEISPDNIIFWQQDWLVINATLVYSWLVMLILVIASWLATRDLVVDPNRVSRWQNTLEIIVEQLNTQIREGIRQEPTQFLPFIGTLFLFIGLSNVLTLFPYYESPAGSLSTAAALAICVLVAVPFYGIKNVGIGNYLKTYISPLPLMLPFNIMSEISRTLSLAVRLFGNIMSTSLLVSILVVLIPWIFPAITRAFGMLIGVIQAYVFSILALVYIASGMQAQRKTKHQIAKQQED
ncbi:F0F1 ATP synthase subunit A [Euhalothece natronophila Z-M001]|uniref:ATP synthase subunit a n=1 Tax=Euhalothece natronophila Z-M001 TaxID=522448 RepID=A0A5B8NM63_9CHRO|nr:F0F1 ATP synthase subunit A [Euhalothece natronophila]QDZ40026.1 F0F1 ATP synthase subunit A [Euhalothece natronophila Z-M001]